MVILISSAAFVGLMHTLAPGHWLPVVLMAKTRHWSLKKAMLGAITSASGHIIISLTLGLVSIYIGSHFFSDFEEDIERFGGLLLAAFGSAYAIYSYFRHSSCHGHTHHGPDPEHSKAPYIFLFSLGFSPCVAVVPIVATAGASGPLATMLTMVGFSLGVVTSLIGATVVTTTGLMKLDHPIFEHYGDVIAGAGIAIMGIVLYLLPHTH